MCSKCQTLDEIEFATMTAKRKARLEKPQKDATQNSNKEQRRRIKAILLQIILVSNA